MSPVGAEDVLVDRAAIRGFLRQRWEPNNAATHLTAGRYSVSLYNSVYIPV